jgi:DNA (cytosine-5)-methyltransferase 1
MDKLRYIDLFAGAGGLSEGFIRNGFIPVAHVEMNADACNTLKTRSVFHYLKSDGGTNTYHDYLNGRTSRETLWNHVPKELTDSVINKRISHETLPEIFSVIDDALHGQRVDVIIGGPPCQAYSVAGRARDPSGMEADPRNFLYKYYVEFLKRYEPKMFVFENVPGILSAGNGIHLKNIFTSARQAGYEAAVPHGGFLNAKDFNVLQDRKRVIIIGWRKELNLDYPEFKKKEHGYQILKDLFSDLPGLKNGQGTLGAVKYTKPPTEYLRFSGIRTANSFTTQHIVRPNNKNDLEIYRLAVDEWSEGRRLNYSRLPERLVRHSNREIFTNRFQVVNGLGISHTVVAHIAMDGHYYIHPDRRQNRSISVREAARIQSFPDDYFFEGSRTSAFRQIGNAVPVLMAEGIASRIREML